jgi:hypothetical protein
MPDRIARPALSLPAAAVAAAAVALALAACAAPADPPLAAAEAASSQRALDEYIDLERATMTSVDRADGEVLFRVYAEQLFSSTAPDVQAAELDAPATIRLAVWFPDETFFPVRFDRRPDHRYTVSAFGGEPLEQPTEAAAGPLSLHDFIYGTTIFTMASPNLMHQVALDWEFDPNDIRASFPVILPRPPWNEAWANDCYSGDFECSDQGPIEVPEAIVIDGVFINWLGCCLEHDRAFFCGGTGGDFMAANRALADCVRSTIMASSAQPVLRWFTAELWWALFFNGTVYGNLATGVQGWPWDGTEQFANRRETCLCGGTVPVPLCDLRCDVNTCERPHPLRVARSSWENLCVPTCEWSCVDREGTRSWEPTMCTFNEDGSRSGCAISGCDPGVPMPDGDC